jgi:adenine deaminase
MAAAVNRLAETGGGQVVVRQGQVIGLVELPIGGLVSNEPAEHVARNAERYWRASALRLFLNNPNMQLSLLGLVVIPELRISDLGLVDVNQFQICL